MSGIDDYNYAWKMFSYVMDNLQPNTYDNYNEREKITRMVLKDMIDDGLLRDWDGEYKLRTK